MPVPTELRLVVVTPETTLLDEQVASVRYPLYDGMAGLLPGRAPMVGRLGSGELSFATSAGESTYFVDGGFVQVKGPVVSVLTNRALVGSEIDPADAEEELREARAASARGSDDTFAEKQAREDRARRMLAVARKAR